MHAELQLDNQICFRLYTAARLITQAYTPMLNELGITYPQYLVLMVLWEQDSQPVNDIAHRLQLETNTVTPLLQRMEKLTPLRPCFSVWRNLVSWFASVARRISASR